MFKKLKVVTISNIQNLCISASFELKKYKYLDISESLLSFSLENEDLGVTTDKDLHGCCFQGFPLSITWTRKS